MRLGELSAASDVPIPTIKFYLREGLLHPGDASGAARYDQTHVHRLRLVRALIDLGGLSLQRVATVIAEVDAGDPAAGLVALVPPIDDDPALPLGEADAFLADQGFRGTPDPVRRTIARALLELRRAGLDVEASVLRPHARAAAWLVSEEADAVGDASQAAVLATTAFGAALAALRVAARISRG